MTVFSVVYHVARADFLERTRRYGYILTLLFTMYAAYLFLPPPDAPYVTLHMDGHRGIYNSAWVGTLVALLTTIFLSLAGFYLVKNALGRDRQTGVGQILAATPLASVQYLLGKFLSNVTLLSSMVFVMIVAAGMMQLVRGEDYQINIPDLALPLILLALPVMAIVGALAILFESVSFLRRGFGNIVFYVFWNVIIITNLTVHAPNMLVTSKPILEMQRSTEEAYPEYRAEDGGFALGFQFKGDGGQWDLTTYRWNGMHWGIGEIMMRILWALMSGVLLIPSILLFDRFAETTTVKRTASGIKRQPRTSDVENREKSKSRAGASFSLPWNVPATVGKGIFPALVTAELRLILKGVNRWWYFVVLVFVVLGLVLPIDMVRGYVLPLAAIWPILLWSGMGTREYRHRAHEILHSTQYGGRYKLAAEWAAGVLVGLLVTLGVGLDFIIAGEWGLIGSLAAGLLFACGLAIGLGVWSGSGKLFEILYLILWYVGPMSKAPPVDFLGSTDESVASGIPGIAALVGMVAFILALLRPRKY